MMSSQTWTSSKLWLESNPQKKTLPAALMTSADRRTDGPMDQAGLHL